MSENEPKESQGYVAFGRNVGPIDEKDRELWVESRSKRCAACWYSESEHELIPHGRACAKFVAPNDVTLTAEAVEEGARRFAERIQKLTREQLAISSPDRRASSGTSADGNPFAV